MQRTAVLFLLIFCSFSLAELKAQSVKTGVKTGIGFSNFYDGGTDFNNRTGYAIGGFARFEASFSPFSMQPEILYIQKGAESNGSDIKLDYIELPILFKADLFNDVLPLRPDAFVGLYSGLNLNRDSSFLGDTDDVEVIDFGGLFGASFDFEAGSSVFTIDARYSFGMIPAFDSGSSKNRIFVLSAGIVLPS